MTDDPSSAATADLSDWLTPQRNPRSFHHAEDILPTAAIAHEPASAREWPPVAGPNPLAAFTLTLGPDRSLTLDAFLRATRTDAFVVLHDGQLVHEAYFNGMTSRSRHILMSMSKSIVGVLCGILAERGQLDLEAPVMQHLPDVRGGPYEAATLRQLLDMRFEPDLSQTDLAAYDAAVGWSPQPASVTTGLAAFFAKLGAAAHQPYSGAFRYVSANTDLVGLAVEAATGRDLARLTSDLLWKPMGAESAAYLALDRAGAPQSTRGFGATARDVARLGQLIVDAGLHDSTVVIPAAWIDDTANRGDAGAWANGEFAAGFNRLPMHYRNGWYAIDQTPQTLFAMGVYGQNLFVDRANRLVVAKLSSHPARLVPEMLGLTLMALPAIRRCVLG